MTSQPTSPSPARGAAPQAPAGASPASTGPASDSRAFGSDARSDAARRVGAEFLAFSSLTDGELRDPRQLLGLARAIDPAAPADALATGLFIAESVNVIQRALDAGYRPFAVLTDRRWRTAAAPLIEALRAANPALPVAVVPTEEVRAITGYQTTRGPLAAFHRKPLPSPRDLLRGAHRVAVLEDITNYTNIGALFRSAAALGIDAVLLTPACHDPLYRRASRVSMGTVFQVPWTRLGTDNHWAAEGVPLLREAGFATAALALRDDSRPLQDPHLKTLERLALILGTEGDGLADGTIARCDYTVRIPMAHGVDSLNVAAASAVAFWELRWENRQD